jgi:hypothetical protein
VSAVARALLFTLRQLCCVCTIVYIKSACARAVLFIMSGAMLVRVRFC